MRSPIIVALDLPSPDTAMALARRVAPHLGIFEIGREPRTRTALVTGGRAKAIYQ